jgi:hypothetical protein
VIYGLSTETVIGLADCDLMVSTVSLALAAIEDFTVEANVIAGSDIMQYDQVLS